MCPLCLLSQKKDELLEMVFESSAQSHFSVHGARLISAWDQGEGLQRGGEELVLEVHGSSLKHKEAEK